jgi:hypothetical protein
VGSSLNLLDRACARIVTALGRGLAGYRGQRRTTVMAKVSKRFVSETLWPEYEQLSNVLRRHLDEVTERIIATAIHDDASEAVDAADAESPLLRDS